jgi:GntR family transcriptional regulator/MocR family aminotransferase
MELSIHIHPKATASYQKQISDQFIELIITNRIRAGERLPSSRMLSQQIKVSRNTVNGAYDKLIKQGYIESKPGSGTYACKILPDDAIQIRGVINDNNSIKNTHPIELTSKTQGREENLYRQNLDHTIFDFQIERTDPHSFPTKIWRRIINKRLGEARANMTRYSDLIGLFELRNAIASRLGSTRGILVNPEQIIILTGIQQGLNIVSHLLIRKGAKVVLESPGYKGASYVFENYGASIFPVPVDEKGIMINQLPKTQIDVAMITPSRHFPLSATLPEERRKKLIEWANNTDSYLLEVDYDSDFRYEGSPLRAIKSFDTEQRVIYLSSFLISKDLPLDAESHLKLTLTV